MITNKFLMKLNRSYEQLDLIDKFEDNWNNNGAKKFSEDVISCVRAFISSFIDVPFVAPTANESIRLWWENGDYYIEFEISDNNLHTIHLFIYNNIKDKKIEDKIFTNYSDEDLLDIIHSINDILKLYGFGENSNE